MTLYLVLLINFSKNLAQSDNYEPQSSHFNKQQYSLHCTVKYYQDDFKYYKYYEYYEILNLMWRRKI